MFIDTIQLVTTQPCLAEPGKIRIVGRPSRSLADVLPYLAALPNVIAFNPDTLTVTFRRQPGFLTVHAGEVFITQVRDTEEGLDLLEALKDAINATWANRAHITPLTARRRAPGPMDVWALLPQTNCAECGEATCMAFAVGLLSGQRQVSDCAPLHDAAQAAQLAALEAMV